MPLLSPRVPYHTSSNMPAIGYLGGKARLAQKITSFLLKEGRMYVEPFAGPGDLFWAAASSGLRYARWRLNDIATIPFFQSIKARPKILPRSLGQLCRYGDLVQPVLQKLRDHRVKTPFLKYEKRIEDRNGRRIRHMARWKPEGWLDKPLATFKAGGPSNGILSNEVGRSYPTD